MPKIDIQPKYFDQAKLFVLLVQVNEFVELQKVKK